MSEVLLLKEDESQQDGSVGESTCFKTDIMRSIPRPMWKGTFL